MHRHEVDQVRNIYANAEEFERYVERLDCCTEILKFGRQVDFETGEISLKLRETKFCRVRYCPVCQWRRSLMWKARFFKVLPEIKALYPTGRWLFLTLTVKNCEISELKETLQEMRNSWRKLIKRKEFSPVLGWVRTTEITRSKDGKAHPHFHALLLVRPSYFAKDYVKQERWGTLWQECLRVNYAPSVDVRTIKEKQKSEEAEEEISAEHSSIMETLKYAVKPSDMTEDSEWFLEMTRQTHKLRFMATGGVLKEILKETKEEEGEDLILLGASGQADDGSRMGFKWDQKKHYLRYAKGDRTPNVA